MFDFNSASIDLQL